MQTPMDRAPNMMRCPSARTKGSGEMSLLEIIAKRSRTDAATFSLPELLAGQALARVSDTSSPQVSSLISQHFAAETLRDTSDGARRYAELLMDHGVTEQRLLNGYIAGAAEVLGRAWEEDTLSFAQVTHAMGNLTRIAREMMSPPPARVASGPALPRILMARAPGEDHTLGLMLTAQEMRRAGWLVRLDLSGDEASLAAALHAQRFDLVGFSACTWARIPALIHAIKLCRRMQDHASVVVGGWLGHDDPEQMAQRLGADIVLGRQSAPLPILLERFALVPV
ncbi:cobalamin B12-binding domain-containing protein [Halovulum dunhuangense]|uniref:Cobalamin B12-binding domain-containing protein n=1 Tax=Halovulum dunhuangense TaxID=1505036 RepID=A0A849KQL3_9RHOB|nr:cobalamin B12-binding domain-containing protein [Halovulum dunhuangense]NNU79363.1 cobalamin B12-binding domain-containing protein [Halovulum dunhuangense]